jgi:serine/threonine-protein kinase
VTGSSDSHAGDWTVPGYVTERELGAGAGGRVVIAVHVATGRPVAIKYLGERLRGEAAFRAAFREEAELLGGLDTPYVTRLFEYVESTAGAGAGAAIVMELVDGVALRALLRQEGPTIPEAALVVLKGSLLGLAAAHGSGVVHRDYKPENVLVTREGQTKLVDFGIARRSGSRAGDISGTPAYMAPEQWRGEPADAAGDVYAATVTFFECLTGQRPFTGASPIELAVQHTEAPVPVDRLPEAVRELVLRGMAKSPADRPASAAAFLAELEQVAGAAYGPDWQERGRRALAAIAALVPLLFPRPRTAPGGGTAMATTRLPERSERPERTDLPGRDRRGLLATLTALVVALLVVAATLAPGWAGEDDPRTEVATDLGTTTPTPTPSESPPPSLGSGDGGASGEPEGSEPAPTTPSEEGGGGGEQDSGGQTDGGGDAGGGEGDTDTTEPEETYVSFGDVGDMWVVWEDADTGGCECHVAYANVTLTVEGPDPVDVDFNWYQQIGDEYPGTWLYGETWTVDSSMNGLTHTASYQITNYADCYYSYRLDVYPHDPYDVTHTGTVTPECGPR